MGFGKYGFSIFEQKTLCYDFFFGKKARSSSWFRFWTHLLLLSKEIKNCSKISNKTWIFNQNIILHWIHFSGLQTCYETFLNFFIHCDYHLLIVDRETAQNDFGEVFFFFEKLKLLCSSFWKSLMWHLRLLPIVFNLALCFVLPKWFETCKLVFPKNFFFSIDQWKKANFCLQLFKQV